MNGNSQNSVTPISQLSNGKTQVKPFYWIRHKLLKICVKTVKILSILSVTSQMTKLMCNHFIGFINRKLKNFVNRANCLCKLSDAYVYLMSKSYISISLINLESYLSTHSPMIIVLNSWNRMHINDYNAVMSLLLLNYLTAKNGFSRKILS